MELEKHRFHPTRRYLLALQPEGAMRVHHQGEYQRPDSPEWYRGRNRPALDRH